MLPNIIILLGSTLFMCAAMENHKCNDCLVISKCISAEAAWQMQQVAQLKAADDTFCGFEGSSRKVCCEAYNVLLSYLQETNAEDEIETHDNINLLSGECGDIEGERIVGGKTTSLFEFPWLVLIRHGVNLSIRHKCAGTLINSRYVLTAAHCIKDKDVTGVRIGEYDITTEIDCIGEGENRQCASKYQDINVVQSITHPNYNNSLAMINDIGLLRLERPANLTSRNSGLICLPVTKHLRDMNISDEMAVVVGWGITETNVQSKIPLKVDLPIHSPERCIDYYNSNEQHQQTSERLNNTMCAGTTGRDSCKDDSGGPLMLRTQYDDSYKFIQLGIVSYGFYECGSGIPGVYTDVRKYMKWILDTIKP